LCDMGGVLVHFNHDAYERGLAELLKPLPLSLVQGITRGEKWHKLLVEFETGAINDERFITGLETLFDRPLPRKAYWTTVHTGRDIMRVDEVAVDILRRVKRKHPNLAVTLVSNVDPFVLKFCVDGMDFRFDHVVPSFRVRSYKPDTFIYKAALTESGVVATNAMFWDDRAENVRAAKDLNICAYRFTDVQAMERVLEGFELL